MYVLRVVACAILLFITQVRGDGGANTNTSSGKVIVVLGDETATGVVEKMLTQFTQTQSAIRIVNAGVSGDITMFTMARLDTDVLSLSPDIVIVSVGRHDIIQGRYVPESQLDLAIIKAKAEDAGAKVVIITPTEFGEILTSESYTRVVNRVHGEVLLILRGDPVCPMPSIAFVPDPRKITQKITISWVAQEGVVYELIKPYPYGNDVGWSVVATVRGAIVDARITLPANEKLEVFRLRAKWEK